MAPTATVVAAAGSRRRRAIMAMGGRTADACTLYRRAQALDPFLNGNRRHRPG